MSDSNDQARDSFIKGLEAKAGKPVEELLVLVASWGPGKHGELLAKAKEAFGLGYGHANLLIHLFRDRAEVDAGAAAADAASDPLDAIYAGSKAPVRALHEALMARLVDLGPFEVAPKKANVSLRRSKQFALLGPGSKGRLEVGVNHREAHGTARFEALAPGKMCSHRAFVAAPVDIDDELLAFVREAYEAAV
ncbi:MAG: DUF4287 domain-containing protein [Trueperaceae bacterium]|nr:DUF4287 domain-containing protein [Trueperaceae bacterium]